MIRKEEDAIDKKRAGVGVGVVVGVEVGRESKE